MMHRGSTTHSELLESSACSPAVLAHTLSDFETISPTKWRSSLPVTALGDPRRARCGGRREWRWKRKRARDELGASLDAVAVGVGHCLFHSFPGHPSPSPSHPILLLLLLLTTSSIHHPLSLPSHAGRRTHALSIPTQIPNLPIPCHLNITHQRSSQKYLLTVHLTIFHASIS